MPAALGPGPVAQAVEGMEQQEMGAEQVVQAVFGRAEVQVARFPQQPEQGVFAQTPGVSRQADGDCFQKGIVQVGLDGGGIR